MAITRSLSLSLTITRSLTLFFGPTRSLSLLLGPSRSFSVPLALSHHYSVPHAHPCNLRPLQGPSHSLPLFLAIYDHHTAPFAPSHYHWVPHAYSRSFSLSLAIHSPSRSISHYHSFLTLIFALSHSLPHFLALTTCSYSASLLLAYTPFFTFYYSQLMKCESFYVNK